MTLKEILNKAEREAILERLREYRCKITKTAISLGITRKCLWEKMKKYEIYAQFISLPGEANE